MPPVDVLLATDGQDRGARFGLLGTEATIGRGPVMDLVLTDPRVSRRHAMLRMDGGRLLVEDLGSTAGTLVNGHPVTEPTVLARGDRLRLGDTELTVVWTPGHSPAGPPAPPETSPTPVPHAPAAVPDPAAAHPPARPAPGAIELRADGARPARRQVGWGVVLAAGALVAALLATIAITQPALSGPAGTVSIWGMEIAGLRALVLCAGIGAVALAAAWLACEADAGRAGGRAPLAAAACGWGGLVTGTPLFVGAAATPGYEAASGLGAMAFAGIAFAACGVARLALIAGPRRGPRPGRPDREELLVGAGALGGLCMAAAGPMTWVSRGGIDIGGFDDTIATGRWIVPFGLTVAAACVIAALTGHLVDRRTTLPVAGAAGALAGAGLTFAVAAGISLSEDIAGSGLTLALTGGALATSVTVGGLFMLLARETDPDHAPAERHNLQ